MRAGFEEHHPWLRAPVLRPAYRASKKVEGGRTAVTAEGLNTARADEPRITYPFQNLVLDAMKAKDICTLRRKMNDGDTCLDFLHPMPSSD